MKIYTVEDRVKIKIGELVVSISPLSFKQKMEIQAKINENASEGTLLAIRHGVKKVEGVERSNGEKYELSFEDGLITDICANDLLNMEMGGVIATACVNLIQGIPKELVHPETGKPLEGVEILNP